MKLSKFKHRFDVWLIKYDFVVGAVLLGFIASIVSGFLVIVIGG